MAARKAVAGHGGILKTLKAFMKRHAKVFDLILIIIEVIKTMSPAGHLSKMNVPTYVGFIELINTPQILLVWISTLRYQHSEHDLFY